MDMTDPKRHFSQREEKRFLKLAAEVARTEYPNPERAGCPAPEILKALALRQIPLDQTGDVIDHIGTCSPCFTQYWDYRRGHKRQKTIQLLLVCLGIAVLTGIVLSRPWQPRSGQEPQVAKGTPKQQGNRQLVFDLRAWSSTRSDAPREERPELRLPRAPVQLSIYLPIGSEDGGYDLQLQQSPPRLPLEARGEARLRNNIELLEVTLDTSKLSPGHYLLRLRRPPAGWSEYPIQIE